ncbi:carotenoid biosynthesis protein [Phototrophicus methaneseepsis]|uniref:Carotenoid biosynthesis protein n=1 Tax=Phototrophicus methaneseepsis TaxID=2710758 RepID=A0A7S8E6R6_9CHLR|nr:carotenoid biosynthesis protein [Phototrophicus methaneseepsis]QPC81408.1 carotenoid biosynthesis protein [Phototrophicus methaneseepsis]
MTTLPRFIRKPQIHTMTVWQYGLIALWALAMITLPIGRWVAGDAIIPGWTTMAAILQSAAAFSVLVAAWGWHRAIRTFFIIALIGWAAEFVGHQTGFPFGHYTYTDVLHPQIGGVPLLIPIAWFMLMPSAWAMAQCIIPDRTTLKSRLAFVGVSALALTVWDLFLDPQMVGWGFWEWAQPGIYFGIPLQNYAGWFAVSALITLVAQPQDLPIPSLALIYGLVWFLQMVGLGVFWGQIGPALVGSVAMGSILLAAYYRKRNAP